ncbi:hemolysin family protein [Saccharomonospora azurea]|uniref:CBS domain-containing protein n=1 Tax=Saccharomonospora azurea NA-128 TaxID=882081 RepID=H8GF26_9PSEU|nr:hemolysin family protein [Saccharomonospora azurea]EHK86130.1 CBS domain-containing protein [Saccharomonospora azurea SZMC 14600]EHY91057.1 CBS domain-containing protein [Saccharomonospora azurea NA-128]
MTSSAIVLVVAVLLVLLGGLFAAADAAISTVSLARAEGLERAGRFGSRQLIQVIGERTRHLNLLLLLRMGCELTATVLVTVVLLRWVEPEWLAVLLAALIMVLVSYVIVGVGPRTIGRQHPYRVGLAVAGVVRALGTVLGPLSRLLIVVGNALTPGGGFREGPFTTEAELRELVDLAEQRGVVGTDEREMIHSVFELGDTVAREVMVPRTEIVWIEQNKTVRQALALSMRTGFTRIPVIGESVDDIVGVVNLKDLVQASFTEEGTAREVRELMTPADFVPDSKHLDGLLKHMQRSRHHLVIAVDEYGGTAGLLTIEDILEEIVGEITDESDTDDRPPIEHVDDQVVRVSARLGVDDLGELFGIDLSEQDVETVGGLLAQRLGRVPLPGAEAEVDGLRLRAEGGKDRRGRMRISTVVVRAADGRRIGPGTPVTTDDNDGRDHRDERGERDEPDWRVNHG